jgi:hypothetical protein
MESQAAALCVLLNVLLAYGGSEHEDEYMACYPCREEVDFRPGRWSEE